MVLSKVNHLNFNFRLLVTSAYLTLLMLKVGLLVTDIKLIHILKGIINKLVHLKELIMVIKH